MGRRVKNVPYISVYEIDQDHNSYDQIFLEALQIFTIPKAVSKDNGKPDIFIAEDDSRVVSTRFLCIVSIYSISRMGQHVRKVAHIVSVQWADTFQRSHTYIGGMWADAFRRCHI
jgi:hypothetical protein